MFFLHEVCHGFECWRQNRCSSCIVVDFKHLSMRCEYDGYVDEPKLVSYAGGVYCSLVCFVMSVAVVGYVYLSWCFLVLGWVQLVYGIFEGCFIGRVSDHFYLYGRYFVYVVIVLANLFLWWWI